MNPPLVGTQWVERNSFRHQHVRNAQGGTDCVRMPCIYVVTSVRGERIYAKPTWNTPTVSGSRARDFPLLDMYWAGQQGAIRAQGWYRRFYPAEQYPEQKEQA